MEPLLISGIVLADPWGQLWMFSCLLNIILAGVIVFFERREPCTVWAWLLVLFFLPVVGFVLYLLFGQDMHKRYLFQMKLKMDENQCGITHWEAERQEQLQARLLQLPQALQAFRPLAWYHFHVGGCVYTNDNHVQILADGEEKFRDLFETMRGAKRYIHIQYYIFKRDELFAEMLDILKEKAAQGVEVRLLYDSLGSREIRRSDWKRIRSCGIRTGDFFPAHFGRLQGRINYRNHRKIVVVDGEVGYIGGYNVGREYISKDKRFGYWRDTHLKLSGSSVTALQMHFSLDWNYATGENLFLRPEMFERGEWTQLGERTETGAGVGIQIITSGPDRDRNSRQIRDTFLAMIYQARKSIDIQTPYFIPDEPVLSALLFAVRSGVRVRLMIPCKPDHPFVYWATHAYMGELLMAGAECFVYENGFLHSKGMVVDAVVACYGTANMDIRSFRLNFEVNALLYDEGVAGELTELFERDIVSCRRVTPEDYEKREMRIRFKEQLFRLLSPLL